MENFVISSKRNKKINIDIKFSKTKNSPLIIFSHGFKGFKDWGAFNLVSNIFANYGLNFLKFNFSHNGVSEENLLGCAVLSSTTLLVDKTSTRYEGFASKSGASNK